MKKIKLLIISCFAATMLLLANVSLAAGAWSMPGGGVEFVEEPTTDVAMPSDDMQDNNMHNHQLDDNDIEAFEVPDAIR